ncbi:LysR substrate-binding domain-containing protein [Pseudohalocynthiibacter sp. F2068]|uniref:LysR family transcriptional regulator n=1 Tax=Pseudohalocynthiibacter sp. F2068 TaxID=2926418 RepID=UPI001FF51999|nr:LysR substrate-binding domain-containing protein [Pseudohalocynthiibacter sp. F2068]MCK0101327.1 LysR family transcriptional regulator [Pseudohalocynthiibacter sp. F2068]
MLRNMDMTALRSFVAVSDAGGVTKAAGFLHVTQSAVSMQLKRLEESLNVQLLDRSARQIGLTVHGEQLLGYARRMLDLNDEVYARLTHQAFEGELTLGVPHDIVYPAVPKVLQRFNAAYPRVRVHLVSSFTRNLHNLFGHGECDIILTTEDFCEAGGETLTEIPLVWIGAPDGTAWKSRPLRLAFEHNCIFRIGVQEALDRAGIPWEMAVESDSSRTIEASVSADLAVHTVLQGMGAPYLEPVRHGGALPELTSKKINLYVSDLAKGQAAEDLVQYIRSAFSSL